MSHLRRAAAGLSLGALLLASAPAMAQGNANPNNTVGVFGWDSGTHLPCIIGAATFSSTCVLPGSGGGGGGGGGAVTGASGSFVDGWNVTLGTIADAACSTDNGNCTGEALAKRLNQRITSLITALGSPAQAGATVPVSGTFFPATQPASAASGAFVVGWSPEVTSILADLGAGVPAKPYGFTPVAGGQYNVSAATLFTPTVPGTANVGWVSVQGGCVNWKPSADGSPTTSAGASLCPGGQTMFTATFLTTVSLIEQGAPSTPPTITVIYGH